MIDILFVDIQSDGVLLKQQKVVPYNQHLAALETQREEWRDNKRYLENDIALKIEQIAALTDENKRLYELLDNPLVKAVIGIEALRGGEVKDEAK